MVWWVYGETGSGKTTLADRISYQRNAIRLDADEIRPAICEDLGYSAEDRRKNNLRIARLAHLLDKQGFDVVVSTICPYEDLRDLVYWVCKCRFIKVEGKYNG